MALLIRATVLAIAVIALTTHLEAQTQSEPAALAIIVAKEIRIQTGTEAALSIGVMPAEAVPRQAMLLIRGLPLSVALTEGRPFQSGIWSLRITDLPKLRMIAPSNAKGRVELVFSVVTLDGVVMTESHSSLFLVDSIAAGDNPTTQQSTASAKSRVETRSPIPANEPPPNLAGQPRPEIRSIEEMESITRLMRRGDESMTTGKVNDARLLYARAAEGGWAPAALALAKTYDGEELAKIAVLGGVRPNVELARKWYKQARDMGSHEAAEKLQLLGQN